MELIHMTKTKTADEIKTNGLLSFKKYVSTTLTAMSKNTYRPQYLPKFMDLNKCMYFLPLEELVFAQAVQKLQLLGKVLIPQQVGEVVVNVDMLVGNIIYVKTLSQNLDPKKLYAAPIVEKTEEATQKVKDFVNNIEIDTLSQNNDFKRLEKIMETDSYKNFLQENKEYIEEYWDNIIPFSEYEKKMNKIPLSERFLPKNYGKYEILYFGDVPANKIEIKSDLFKLKDLFDFIQKLKIPKQIDEASNSGQFKEAMKILQTLKAN